MVKKFLLLLIILLGLPVCAGEVEDALKRGDHVFLYLYSPDCKYCTAFNPHYEQLKKNCSGQYTFLKVNTKTKYGSALMNEYSALYIPFVLLLDGKTHKGAHITPPCIMSSYCSEKALKEFRGK